MKMRDKMLFGLGILILILLHWYLFRTKEGFFDDSSAYNALRGRLQNELGPYCEISAFIRDQVNEMHQGLKAVSGSLPSEDEVKALSKSPAALQTQNLMSMGKLGESWYDYGSDLEFYKIYKGVYSCTDTLAKVRPTCGSPNKDMNYVPCTVYLNLPDWTSEREVIAPLSMIKNDLPERLNREGDWFQAVIDKIQQGLDAGARPQAGDNPPGVAPTPEQMEKYRKEAEGFTYNSEGFTCSEDAMAYLRQKASEAEAKSCTPAPRITSSSEIARVNSLLDNPSVQSSVRRMRSMYQVMLKLKGDLERLKNGDLYDWQRAGPKKTYTACEFGTDRVKAFLCSLKNMN